MANSKAYITKILIDSLKPPSKGRDIVWDTKVTSFGVRITAAGAIAYVVRYVTKDAEEKLFTFGRYPDLPPHIAREDAGTIKTRVREGGDPLADKRNRYHAPTMAVLCDRYLDEYAKLRKRTARGDQSMIDRFVKPQFGKRKIAAITFDDVERFHQSIKATPYQANRVLALLSKMFSLASTRWKDWSLRSDNPCKGVERFHEAKRRRYLSPDETRRLIAAINAHRNTQTANAVRLLILTGARRGEALSATWDQFDLEAGRWTKPSSHTKQKCEHEAPLADEAVDLLKPMRAKAVARGETYLFPSAIGDTPQNDMKRFWKSVCRTAGITGLRIHDLRHSFASKLASDGVPLPLIGELLGHTQVSTTARYAHIYDDPKRAAANRIGAVFRAAKGEDAKAVAPLEKEGVKA